MAHKDIMSVSEKTLERRLKREVENLGGLCLKLPALHVAGIPDRLILMPGGRAHFAELKGSNGVRGKLQKVWIVRLKKLGFTAEFVDSYESLEKFLNIIKS